MIVVDTSVWIDFLNGRDLSHTRRLRAVLGSEEIIIGDLMLCEVLQGLASDGRDSPQGRGTSTSLRYRADGWRSNCREGGPQLLRQRGITIRKTIDLLIGTWCIENGKPLLHNDSDFRPMTRHLGLLETPVSN